MEGIKMLRMVRLVTGSLVTVGMVFFLAALSGVTIAVVAGAVGLFLTLKGAG